MSYSLATLWYDRQRYLPGVLAVAFSAVLIALQFGLLLGLLAVTSIPVDRTRADVWVGAADVLSVDIGGPIDSDWIGRLAECPEIARIEEFIQGFSKWKKSNGGEELCIVVGSRLEDDALGTVEALTPELREKLTEPNSVVVDESELSRLGLGGVGETGEILGRRVRVVGLVRGYKSLAGPYVFCSLNTARPLLRMHPDQVTYLLAQCHDPREAPAVVERLRRYEEMSAFTTPEFSRRSRMHWLTKTKAGVALGYSALLGLLVGAVVTSQTLYAAVAASLREYAILQALGIPRWRVAGAVMAQAFWIGVAGVTIGLPTVFGLARLAELAGIKAQLDPELLGAVTAITLVMAMGSGLVALRSLRLIDPASLLR